MKRLVFCFDGTWDQLDAYYPTNVVLTAQSVSPVAKGSVTQIIHYDQGVGTSKGSKWTGGLFGAGLLDNIVNAYMFLIFNYEIGDEIYVFGFSRGAFTARSFVGLLRTVGILRRADAGEITNAIDRYKSRKVDEDHDSEDLLRYRLRASPQVCVDRKEDAWRCKNSPGYVSGSSPVFRIRYVGVWDTVGSLGVPDTMLFAPLIDKGDLFYDTNLDDLVVSARHAVSIDEQRKSFSPTLWTNFEDLNASLGFNSDDAEAPYQQKWFPGNHGSVGGGGPERGLSDFSLDWVVEGARKAGLQLDTELGSRIFSLSPNVLAPLENFKQTTTSELDLLMKLLPTTSRMPGPDRLSDVSTSARMRWCEPGANLPERKEYRPQTLARVADALNDWAKNPQSHVVTPPNSVRPPTAIPTPGSYYKVVRGDTLSGIAQKAYKAASMDAKIFTANPNLLDGPDHIYVGQMLFIPAAG
jgi:uncharacterized protein (DUF2235 family)